MGKKSRKRATKPGGKKQVPASSFQSPTDLKLGDRIILKNLIARDYNGKLGTVTCLPESVGESRRYGILVDGTSRPIAVRPHNIALSTASQLSTKTTQDQREERDRHKRRLEFAPEETANADQMGMMRMMMNMFMTEENEIEMFGRVIEPMPDFRMELLSDGGGIPSGVDRAWANEYLRLSFEQASGVHMFEVYFMSEKFAPKPPYILKRLGTNDERKVRWYLGRNYPGNIYQHRAVNPYCELLRHSFSNQAYRRERLCRGTTHVAVGFVDLGILLAAELSDPPANRDGPLRFIGIEMSPYNVAKSHVIWQLLRQIPLASPDCELHLWNVVQVWFSATWTEGTIVAVREAVSAILASNQVDNPRVLGLLEHWAHATDLPLDRARAEVARSTSDSRSIIGCLSRKQDRISLAKYELTRDFGVHGEPLYANVLMFDCPEGTPPQDDDETVFSALSWKDLVDTLRGNGLNVVQAAELLALRGISRMASWAQSGQLVVELQCTSLQEAIEDIAVARPWTMSWSNLPDYFDYSDFHRMARQCSINGDTVHFGYSMNWTTEVFGTNLIDFADASIRASLIKESHKNAVMFYRTFGWTEILRIPPPENPINTVSHFVLEILHYEKWCEHFFDLARLQGPCRVGNVERSRPSPLSNTGESTVHFTWTYDPEISFENLAQASIIDTAEPSYV
jgi:hypothetical protein